MKKIVTLNDGVSNAFMEAMASIENGRYSKVITLLSYVKENSQQYDQVMVEYALLISYVNTGALEEAKACIDVLDSIYIENDQIKAIVEQIRRDVLRRTTEVSKTKKMSFEDALKVLNTNELEINTLYDKHPEDPYIMMLKEGIDNVEDVQNEVIKEVVLAQLDVKQFVDELENFVEFSQSLKPINLFENLNNYEADTLRWMLITPENVNKIYQNRRLPSFIRKYVLERAVHYVHYDILGEFDMRIDGENIALKNLPDFHPEFFEVVNSVNQFYNVNDNIYDMISSVLNIVYINNYPENVFENIKKLHATVGYIVNDIFVGRRFDDIISQKTGYKFDDVKSEIKNMELLITFLIS